MSLPRFIAIAFTGLAVLLLALGQIFATPKPVYRASPKMRRAR